MPRAEAKIKKPKSFKKRIGVYAGSFDPPTHGHLDIIERAAKLFDELLILIAHSPEKNALFSVSERKELLEEVVAGIPNAKVDSHQGLTVEYAKKHGACALVRGLRAVVDFEYEASMGNVNRKIEPEIETILIFASPEFYFISSRMVKEVAKNNGPLSELVPACVVKPLQQKLAHGPKNRSKK